MLTTFGLLLTGGRGEGRNGSFGTKLENVRRPVEKRRLDIQSHYNFISRLMLSESIESDWEQMIESCLWSAFPSFKKKNVIIKVKIVNKITF